MATPGGMSGMREIQRQVITAMHAKKPAMRVRVNVATLPQTKKITVWAFRDAENKVIIDNILNFVSVPPEGIPQEEVPGVVMTVVQKMIDENLLEAIPPRMILPAPLVEQMKKEDGGSKWTAYIKMTKAERDKEYEGMYYEETNEERIARIDKAKKEAAERVAAQAARKAARKADQKAARLYLPKTEDIVAEVARKAAQRDAREAVPKKGSQSDEVPGAPQNATTKGTRAAMPSNPYFL